jgi:hypothetical protein
MKKGGEIFLPNVESYKEMIMEYSKIEELEESKKRKKTQ